MIVRRQTFGFLGVLALLGLSAGAEVAHAGGGCCGGGGRAGSYGGYTFARTAYAWSYGGGMSYCSMGGMGGMEAMNMGAMPMASMPMVPARGYGVGMQGMPMGGSASPASAASSARYTCPMHPGVVSATPGTCPYCGMALTRR